MRKNDGAVNDMIVIFKDGHTMEFSDIEDYGSTDDGDYYLTRFGYDIYINSSEVRLIGRKFDVQNQKRGSWS